MDVRVYNAKRDESYKAYQQHYTPNGHMYCIILPDEGHVFGIYVALPYDFDWKDQTHVKITIWVDDQYVRCQYLERYPSRPFSSSNSLRIEKGRKFDLARGSNWEFSLLFGDVHRPAPQEGTIVVAVALGRKSGRARRNVRHNQCRETNTFKHGDLEEVRPSRQGLRFCLSPGTTPERFHFRYADENRAADAAWFPAFATCDGDKRPREADGDEFDGHGAKRPKLHGLEAELARGNEEQSVQNKPFELFPDKVYGVMPFYGAFS